MLKDYEGGATTSDLFFLPLMARKIPNARIKILPKTNPTLYFDKLATSFMYGTREYIESKIKIIPIQNIIFFISKLQGD